MKLIQRALRLAKHRRRWFRTERKENVRWTFLVIVPAGAWGWNSDFNSFYRKRSSD
ncbi:MAG: hypothetical protein JJE44_03060 [Flavobacteriaceae bacterium]|nr:hypothetical protein [Flavobacteriaceae bacterium]